MDMEEDGYVACVEEVPWWLDAPPLPDVDMSHLIDLDDVIMDPLTAAETLIAVSLAGPGPEAQQLLTSLLGRDLTPDDALTVVQLWETQGAWLVGQKHLALVGFVGPQPVTADGFRDDEALVHELAPAWSSSLDFAGGKISQARLLSGTLSATGDLLRAGHLSPYLAWMICDRLAHLPADLARRVEAAILPKACGSFGKDLSRRLRRAVDRVDPVAAAQRHREGRKNRRVEVETQEREEGLLGLHAYLPPGVVLAIHQRLEQKAAEWAALERAALSGTGKGVPRTAPPPGPDGEPSDVPPDDGVLRTKTQLIADALAWFVLGPDCGDPTRAQEPSVVVRVTVDLDTLLRLRDNPADLDRFGCLPAEIVREWAADADCSCSSTNRSPDTCSTKGGAPTDPTVPYATTWPDAT